MKSLLKFRALFFLGTVLSFTLFLTTYGLEYGFGLEPCPLCHLQRCMLFIIFIGFSAGALQNCQQTGRLIYCIILFVCGVLGGTLAVRQLWLQYVAPVQESHCLAGFKQMLASMPLWEVFQEMLQGSQECSQVDFTFLNLPLSAWSLLSFAGFCVYVLFIYWLQIKRRI